MRWRRRWWLWECKPWFSSQGSAAAPWFIIFEYKNVHVLTERHVNGVYWYGKGEGDDDDDGDGCENVRHNASVFSWYRASSSLESTVWSPWFHHLWVITDGLFLLYFRQGRARKWKKSLLLFLFLYNKY